MAGNAPTFNRVRLYSHKWTNYPTDAKQTPCGAFLRERRRQERKSARGTDNNRRPFFYLTLKPRKNDYKSMRVIDDATFAELIKMLADDPKVKLFQKLVLAPKAEPGEQPDEITQSEVKENGIQ